jgi:isoamylase
MGLVGEMSQCLQGSPAMYQMRGPTASINFITCHDGFTLADLVSYDGKHNEANGEGNRDGSNDNYSWNCGWEGPSDDPGVNALRLRQMKNAMAMLMVSQGVPMILMGDEIGRTQHGNNNAYCLDNAISWVDWTKLDEHSELFRFVRHCIAFRRSHPVLRSRTHFQNRDYVGSGYPDISWHGTRAWYADWSGTSRVLAFLLCGKHAKGGTVQDDYVYVAMNMYHETLAFEPPGLPEPMRWRVGINTGVPAPEDIWVPGTEPLVGNAEQIWLGGRSVLVLVGR